LQSATPVVAALVLGSCATGAGALMDRRSRRRIRRRIDLRETLHLGASVERVFAYWAYMKDTPSFLGAPITRVVRGRSIAWATRPGGTVRHAGVVRFSPESAGTRLDLALTYQMSERRGAPRWLVGGDPEQAVRADLELLRRMVER